MRYKWDLDVLYRWPDEVVHGVGRVIKGVEEGGGDIGAEDVRIRLVGVVGY